MARPTEAIIEDLKHFTPSKNDFNATGRDTLRNLCNELLSSPQPSQAITTLFELVEKFPEEDFGTPGIIVHTVEDIGGYEKLLHESLLRQPTTVTVHLLGRLANSCTDLKQKAHYRQILQSTTNHPKIADEAKDLALLFLSNN